jgi:hypothetical protein
MVMSPVGLRIKNDWADESQQQFTRPNHLVSWANKIWSLSHVGLRTKNYCAGKDQQQFTWWVDESMDRQTGLRTAAQLPESQENGISPRVILDLEPRMTMPMRASSNLHNWLTKCLVRSPPQELHNSQNCETVKYGHESHGPLGQTWLCWQRSAAIYSIIRLVW